MAFIKKQKLVEEVKEEPVVETITESVEDNLQSALLEVVADELSYVAKLNRMIELAEEAGKDDLPQIVVFIDNLTALKELYLDNNDCGTYIEPQYPSKVELEIGVFAKTLTFFKPTTAFDIKYIADNFEQS